MPQSAWRIPKHNLWTRSLCAGLGVIFFFPTLSWAFDASTYRPSGFSFSFGGRPIAIPGSLGSVVAVNDAGPGRPLVIHIQDLHCNYEVQANIGRLIDQVHRSHGMRLVAVEGAWLPINVMKLASVPIPWGRREIGDYLLREGKITGPEFYAAQDGRKIRLEGIEDAGLYEANRAAVMRFLNEETQGCLHDLREMLAECKSRVFSPALRQIDAHRTDFCRGELSLHRYSQYLHGKALACNIDVRIYPNLSRLAIRRESLGPDHVGSDALHEELDNLDHVLRDVLYDRPEQRRLDELEHRLDIMEKLLNISARPHEVAEFRTHPEAFCSRAFLEAVCEARSGFDLEDLGGLDKAMQDVRVFYQLADARSRCFVKNLEEKLRREIAAPVALITGGYHSHEIQEELARRNISFVAVRPRLTREDKANPYFDLLRDRRTPLEKLLARNQDIFALPTAFPQTTQPELLLTDYASFPEPVRRLNAVIDALQAVVDAVDQADRGEEGARAARGTGGIKQFPQAGAVTLELSPGVFAVLRRPGVAWTEAEGEGALTAPLRLHGWHVAIMDAATLSGIAQSLEQGSAKKGGPLRKTARALQRRLADLAVVVGSFLRRLADRFNRRWRLRLQLPIRFFQMITPEGTAFPNLELRWPMVLVPHYMQEANAQNRPSGSVTAVRKPSVRSLLLRERILDAMEALGGRATLREIADLTRCKNRDVEYAAKDLNFKAINEERRALGKMPLYPIVHERTKVVQDILLETLEQLGGVATLADLVRYSGEHRISIKRVIEQMDFGLLNRIRLARGMYPLTVIPGSGRIKMTIKMPPYMIPDQAELWNPSPDPKFPGNHENFSQIALPWLLFTLARTLPSTGDEVYDHVNRDLAADALLDRVGAFLRTPEIEAWRRTREDFYRMFWGMLIPRALNATTPAFRALKARPTGDVDLGSVLTVWERHLLQTLWQERDKSLKPFNGRAAVPTPEDLYQELRSQAGDKEPFADPDASTVEGIFANRNPRSLVPKPGKANRLGQALMPQHPEVNRRLFAMWRKTGQGLPPGAYLETAITPGKKKIVGQTAFSFDGLSGPSREAVFLSENDPNHGFVVNVYPRAGFWEGNWSQPIRSFKYSPTDSTYDLAAADIVKAFHSPERLALQGRTFATRLTARGVVEIHSPVNGSDQGLSIVMRVPRKIFEAQALAYAEVVCRVEQDPNHGQVINTYLAKDFAESEHPQPLMSYGFWKGGEHAEQVDSLARLDLLAAREGRALAKTGRTLEADFFQHTVDGNLYGTCRVRWDKRSLDVTFPLKNMPPALQRQPLILDVEKNADQEQVIRVYSRHGYHEGQPVLIKVLKYPLQTTPEAAADARATVGDSVRHAWDEVLDAWRTAQRASLPSREKVLAGYVNALEAIQNQLPRVASAVKGGDAVKAAAQWRALDALGSRLMEAGSGLADAPLETSEETYLIERCRHWLATSQAWLARLKTAPRQHGRSDEIPVLARTLVMVRLRMAREALKNQASPAGGLMAWLQTWMQKRFGMTAISYQTWAWLIELVPMSTGGMLAASIAAWTGLQDPLALAALFLQASWVAFAFLHLFPKDGLGWRALRTGDLRSAYQRFTPGDWMNVGIALGLATFHLALSLAIPHTPLGLAVWSLATPFSHWLTNRFFRRWTVRLQNPLIVIQVATPAGSLPVVAGVRWPLVLTPIHMEESLTPSAGSSQDDRMDRLRSRLHQDRVLDAIAALGGRASVEEIAAVVKSGYTLIYEALSHMDFTRINTERRTLGEGPLYPVVNGKTKKVQDRIITAMEALSGVATAPEIVRLSGLDRKVVNRTLRGMDFALLNEMRQRQGHFPLVWVSSTPGPSPRLRGNGALRTYIRETVVNHPVLSRYLHRSFEEVALPWSLRVLEAAVPGNGDAQMNAFNRREMFLGLVDGLEAGARIGMEHPDVKIRKDFWSLLVPRALNVSMTDMRRFPLLSDGSLDYARAGVFEKFEKHLVFVVRQHRNLPSLRLPPKTGMVLQPGTVHADYQARRRRAGDLQPYAALREAELEELYGREDPAPVAQDGIRQPWINFLAQTHPGRVKQHLLQWQLTGEGLNPGDYLETEVTPGTIKHFYYENEQFYFSFKNMPAGKPLPTVWLAERDPNHGLVVHVYPRDVFWEGKWTRPLRTFRFSTQDKTIDLAAADLVRAFYSKESLPLLGRPYATRLTGRGIVDITCSPDGREPARRMQMIVPDKIMQAKDLGYAEVICRVEKDPNHGQVINTYLASEYARGDRDQPLMSYAILREGKNAEQIDSLARLDIIAAKEGREFPFLGRGWETAFTVSQVGGKPYGICEAKWLGRSARFSFSCRDLDQAMMASPVVLRIEQDQSLGRVLRIYSKVGDTSGRPVLIKTQPLPIQNHPVTTGGNGWESPEMSAAWDRMVRARLAMREAWQRGPLPTREARLMAEVMDASGWLEEALAAAAAAVRAGEEERLAMYLRVCDRMIDRMADSLSDLPEMPALSQQAGDMLRALGDMQASYETGFTFLRQTLRTQDHDQSGQPGTDGLFHLDLLKQRGGLFAAELKTRLNPSPAAMNPHDGQTPGREQSRTFGNPPPALEEFPEFLSIALGDPVRSRHIQQTVLARDAFLTHQPDFDFFDGHLPEGGKKEHYRRQLELLKQLAPPLESQEGMALRWALQLHDIGYVEGDGGNHARQGAVIAERIMRARGLPVPVVELATELIREHMAMVQFLGRGEIRHATFFARVRPEILPLLKIHTALDTAGWNRQVLPVVLPLILDFEGGAEIARKDYYTFRIKKLAKVYNRPEPGPEETERLLKALDRAFGEKRGAFKTLFEEKLDLTGRLSFVSSALVSRDGDFERFAKFLRFLAIIGTLHDGTVELRGDLPTNYAKALSSGDPIQSRVALDSIMTRLPDFPETMTRDALLEALAPLRWIKLPAEWDNGQPVTVELQLTQLVPADHLETFLGAPVSSEDARLSRSDPRDEDAFDPQPAGTPENREPSSWDAPEDTASVPAALAQRAVEESVVFFGGMSREESRSYPMTAVVIPRSSPHLDENLQAALRALGEEGVGRFAGLIGDAMGELLANARRALGVFDERDLRYQLESTADSQVMAFTLYQEQLREEDWAILQETASRSWGRIPALFERQDLKHNAGLGLETVRILERYGLRFCLVYTREPGGGMTARLTVARESPGSAWAGRRPPNGEARSWRNQPLLFEAASWFRRSPALHRGWILLQALHLLFVSRRWRAPLSERRIAADPRLQQLAAGAYAAIPAEFLDYVKHPRQIRLGVLSFRRHGIWRWFRGQVLGFSQANTQGHIQLFVPETISRILVGETKADPTVAWQDRRRARRWLQHVAKYHSQHLSAEDLENQGYRVPAVDRELAPGSLADGSAAANAPGLLPSEYWASRSGVLTLTQSQIIRLLLQHLPQLREASRERLLRQTADWRVKKPDLQTLLHALEAAPGNDPVLRALAVLLKRAEDLPAHVQSMIVDGALANGVALLAAPAPVVPAVSPVNERIAGLRVMGMPGREARMLLRAIDMMLGAAAPESRPVLQALAAALRAGLDQPVNSLHLVPQDEAPWGQVLAGALAQLPDHELGRIEEDFSGSVYAANQGLREVDLQPGAKVAVECIVQVATTEKNSARILRQLGTGKFETGTVAVRFTHRMVPAPVRERARGLARILVMAAGWFGGRLAPVNRAFRSWAMALIPRAVWNQAIADLPQELKTTRLAKELAGLDLDSRDPLAIAYRELVSKRTPQARAELAKVMLRIVRAEPNGSALEWFVFSKFLENVGGLPMLPIARADSSHPGYTMLPVSLRGETIRIPVALFNARAAKGALGFVTHALAAGPFVVDDEMIRLFLYRGFMRFGGAA